MAYDLEAGFFIWIYKNYCTYPNTDSRSFVLPYLIKVLRQPIIPLLPDP